jgi:hypothetical protein
MGGVDRSDHYCAKYSLIRKAMKRLRKLFFRCLEVCSVNSLILYSEDTAERKAKANVRYQQALSEAGILVAKEVTSLNGEHGSCPPKPRCEVSCRGLRGIGVVVTLTLIVPSGHQASSRRIYAFQLYGALRVVTDYFPGSRGTEMESRETKRKAKAKQGGSVTQSPYQKIGSLRHGVSSSDTPPQESESLSRPEVP